MRAFTIGSTTKARGRVLYRTLSGLATLALRATAVCACVLFAAIAPASAQGTPLSGEIVGLAGLVGSGRSELAQVIFGFISPDSGEMLMDGKVVHIANPGQAMRLGIAYVPEDRSTQGLIRQMRLRENVSMAYYEAGHMMYIHVPSLAQLKKDLTAFIREAIPAA